MTFHEFLHRHAARRSDNYALRTVDRSITYSELEDSVNRTAAHLLNLGLRRGDRIAIYWSNSLETVQLLLAAFRAGLIAVPINVRLKAPEIACILEHSGAKVCFSEPRLIAIAKQAQRDGRPEIVSELQRTNESSAMPVIDPSRLANRGTFRPCGRSWPAVTRCRFHCSSA